MVNDIQDRTITHVDNLQTHGFDYFASSWPISDQDDGFNDIGNKIKSNIFLKKIVRFLFTNFCFYLQVVKQISKNWRKTIRKYYDVRKMLKKVFGMRRNRMEAKKYGHLVSKM